jgi:hypothetical protein
MVGPSTGKEIPMRVFIASLAFAIAMMGVLASSSFARTNGHFPEGLSPPACEVLANNEAALSNPPVMPVQANNPPSPASGLDGSDIGYFNKVDLFTDACL